MQFSLEQTFNGSNEVAAADKYAHQIRLMTVARELSTKPSEGPKLPVLQQRWSVASKEAVDDGKPFGPCDPPSPPPLATKNLLEDTDAVALCFLLTCALLMTSSHSEGLFSAECWLVGRRLADARHVNQCTAPPTSAACHLLFLLR